MGCRHIAVSSTDRQFRYSGLTATKDVPHTRSTLPLLYLATHWVKPSLIVGETEGDSQRSAIPAMARPTPNFCTRETTIIDTVVPCSYRTSKASLRVSGHNAKGRHFLGPLAVAGFYRLSFLAFITRKPNSVYL